MKLTKRKVESPLGEICNPYSMQLNHGKREIILTYDKTILHKDFYPSNLDIIMKQIEWCIKKSFYPKTKKFHLWGDNIHSAMQEDKWASS